MTRGLGRARSSRSSSGSCAIRNPLVDLSVFRSRSFTAGNIIGVVTGFGLYGSALMMPLYFQNVMGFDRDSTRARALAGRDRDRRQHAFVEPPR